MQDILKKSIDSKRIHSLNILFALKRLCETASSSLKCLGSRIFHPQPYSVNIVLKV